MLLYSQNNRELLFLLAALKVPAVVVVFKTAVSNPVAGVMLDESVAPCGKQSEELASKLPALHSTPAAVRPSHRFAQS